MIYLTSDQALELLITQSENYQPLKNRYLANQIDIYSPEKITILYSGII